MKTNALFAVVSTIVLGISIAYAVAQQPGPRAAAFTLDTQGKFIIVEQPDRTIYVRPTAIIRMTYRQRGELGVPRIEVQIGGHEYRLDVTDHAAAQRFINYVIASDK